MKVKIKDIIYDANEEPIMLILTDEDKMHIANMDRDCTKFCAFPDDTETEKIEEFMKVRV